MIHHSNKWKNDDISFVKKFTIVNIYAMDKEISIVSPAAFCPYNHETMTLYPNQSMGMHVMMIPYWFNQLYDFRSHH